jgi:hypothetical protein
MIRNADSSSLSNRRTRGACSRRNSAMSAVLALPTCSQTTFIKEELHAAELASCRSRAAANPRHARISSFVKFGKSRKISLSVIPPPRYSSASYTVIRVPLMQGFPLLTSAHLGVYGDSGLPVHPIHPIASRMRSAARGLKALQRTAYSNARSPHGSILASGAPASSLASAMLAAAERRPVEVVEKVRRQFRNSDDEKSASQNPRRSTIDGLGRVKGSPKIRCIDHSGLFLQAR